MFVGEGANERLQERGRELVRKRNYPDMAVVQSQRAFQDRINRRDQRLECVVDQVGETEREENPQNRRGLGRRGREIVVDASRRAVGGRFRSGTHHDTLSALRLAVAVIWNVSLKRRACLSRSFELL